MFICVKCQKPIEAYHPKTYRCTECYRAKQAERNKKIQDKRNERYRTDSVYRERRNAKCLAKAKRRAATDPDRRAELAARNAQCKRERAERDPAFNMSKHASRLLRQALTTGRRPQTWHRYFAFTLDECRAHLERQFDPVMSWENISEWHIDHAKPRSAFSPVEYRDPQWELLWALENLQPLWPTENSRKGTRH